MSSPENPISPPEAEKSSEQILYSIVDTSRTPSTEYRALIACQDQRDKESRSSQAEYAVIGDAIFYPEASHARDFFRQRLAGQILIDLGGGYGTTIERLAALVKPRVYVNVDRFPSDPRKPNPLKPLYSESTKAGYLKQVVHSDMLDFAARVREGVGNFIINGIDPIIVNDMNYQRAVAHEVIRATKQGGLIFGTNSAALDYIASLIKEGLVELRMVDLKTLGLSVDSETFIFEKVK